MTSAISQGRTYPRAADRRRELELAAVRAERAQPAVQTDRFHPAPALRRSTRKSFTGTPAEDIADPARWQQLGIQPGSVTTPKRVLSGARNEGRRSSLP